MNDEVGIGEVLGYAFAIVLFIAMPVVILAVNVLAFKRHSTSKCCALAIMLVAAAWLVAMAGGAAVQSLAPTSPLRLIPFVICLLMTVTSLVLAIVGIVECRRHHRYRRGKKRAVIALILDLLFFAGAGYLLISGLYQHRFLTG